MKKSLGIIIIVVVSLFIFLLGFNYKVKANPNIFYKVYLNGEVLGIIDSKEKLENYIDTQNDKYKKQFNVKKIYAPNGLEIKKIETYNGVTNSVEDIYNMISEKESFTVKGYKFTIKKDSLNENEEQKYLTIYTLKKDTFKNAVESFIKTFVGEDIYKLYKNNAQEEITTTGTKVEKVYISEEITVKDAYIPVTEKVYTEASELAKYFVFGENSEQNKYTIKIGDTIESVAFDHKISVEEFLISNSNFSSSNSLLFPGQEVNIGITNPQISVVMEQYSVQDKEIAYSTEIQYDISKVIGDDQVVQSGENGLERVTQRVKYVNGIINYVDPISKEELKPAINEIIVKGEKYIPTVGSTSNWLWPTNSGYTISSYFTYRINPITGSRELHGGIDIAGTGYGSPIYAVTNGVVYQSNYKSTDGNNVCLNHNNGYYTCYAHMSKRNVEVGQTVARGDIIGYVGNSGMATGPHLHFEVWIGIPWRGYRINPLTKY